MRMLAWGLVFGLLGCDDGGSPPPDQQDATALAVDAASSDAAVATDDAALPDAAPLDAAQPPAPDQGVGGRLVLNEVVPAPEAGADWLELQAMDGPVALAAYTLVDDADGRTPAPLPARMLAAGERLVVAATDEAPADGTPWVPFKLGASDGLTLARAGQPVDHFAWESGEAPAGTSLGRLPDGTGAWARCLPTSAAPNQPFEGALTAFDPDRVVEVRIDLTPADWAALRADPLAKTWYPGTLTFDGRVVPGVAVRTKGNSSLNAVGRQNSDRYSFKVDIDAEVPGQRVLGARMLNLNNGFKDPTLMRETLAAELAATLDLPAPRTAFVDLWVAGVHLGLYTLVEQVDGDFLKAHFENNDGDLYKPEPPAGALTWRGEAAADYVGLEPESNEATTDHAAFLALVGALRNGEAAQLAEVLDIEEVLGYLALQTALVSLDSYPGSGHNYYLYEVDGRFSVIPWDANEAFGNFQCGCDRAGLVGLRINEPTCSRVADRPLIARLLADPEVMARYHERLRTLVEGPLAPAALHARITRIATLIRPYVAADTAKFFSTQDFERGLTMDVAGGAEAGWFSPGLETFMAERVASIQAQLAGDLPAGNNGNGSCSGGGGNPNPPGMHPCGDGRCDQAEQGNPRLCPRDCGGVPPPNGDWCGDGLCDGHEQWARDCPVDCP